MNQHKKIKAVKFYREAKLHHATISDLWEDGALLRSEAGDITKVGKGTAGEYYLTTSYGKTKFRGITREVAHKGNAVCWKIEFTEVSPFKEDPLRIIIDEINSTDSVRDGVWDQQNYG